MSEKARLQAWVAEEQRRHFRAMANARGLSESRLLGRLVEAVVAATAVGAPNADADDTLARSKRMMLRLRPGDRGELQRRAMRRRMKASTYVAGLVRAHLVADPVVPAPELAELTRALEAVAAVGRNLNQIARQLNSAGGIDASITSTLEESRQAVEDVRQRVKDVVRVTTAAWDAPYE
jgi:hypothetical protein